MKKEITIYTNLENYKFFNQFLTNYIVNYKSINDLLYDSLNNEKGGIIIKKNLANIDFDLSNLSKNYILITADKIISDTKKNIKILKPPLYPYQLKKNIEDFLNNSFLEIADISIHNQKILNLKNKETCSLTEIENKILNYLISNKSCTKEYIKVKILKIKSSIETNSVDTHLTRIRKKLDSINTEIKISSKNNIISIEISQKN
ncbi:winged helix-turn-helix domain-containing protein [Pelagibacteraceae bacterium]|nr:winged helix-turn-helix domain-containing protein [Pelagibacteraceae bacterium]